MKNSILIILMIWISNNLYGQVSTIQTHQDGHSISWGSVSAAGENYGFYGQSFTTSKPSKLHSISVYIFDHPDYKESEANINFSIWKILDNTKTEIYNSENISIQVEEVGGWKTYTFDDPPALEQGNYIAAVGQNEVQGFVGFGNGIRHETYEGDMWGKFPLDNSSNGKEWFLISDLIKKMNVDIDEFQLERFNNSCLMMKLELIK